MPRKQRIDPSVVTILIPSGGLPISRGNYRKDLAHDKTSEAFERMIFEAAIRCGWKRYVYVIMSNHYHPVIETPEANIPSNISQLLTRNFPDST